MSLNHLKKYFSIYFNERNTTARITSKFFIGLTSQHTSRVNPDSHVNTRVRFLSDSFDGFHHRQPHVATEHCMVDPGIRRSADTVICTDRRIQRKDKQSDSLCLKRAARW